MKLFEYGLIHLIFYSTCIWYFGFVYGIIAIISIITTFDYILSFFGIVRLNFHDFLITFESGSDCNTFVCILITDKMDTEKFKKHFYERVLTKVQKARSVRVGWPGLYFWKEIDPKIAQSVVYKLDRKLKTEQEMVDYVNIILPQKMDTSKPLYEIGICEEYCEDKSAIF